MRSKLVVFALSMWITCTSCIAAELSATAKAEINALLERLAASGCQFNRNGTWYGSVKAKSHLARKLDYLIDKKLVENPEQFITMAGTKSSQSGETYLVKCGSENAVPSATWLTAQLQDLRAKKPSDGTGK